MSIEFSMNESDSQYRILINWDSKEQKFILYDHSDPCTKPVAKILPFNDICYRDFELFLISEFQQPLFTKVEFLQDGNPGKVKNVSKRSFVGLKHDTENIFYIRFIHRFITNATPRDLIHEYKRIKQINIKDENIQVCFKAPSEETSLSRLLKTIVFVTEDGEKQTISEEYQIDPSIFIQNELPVREFGEIVNHFPELPQEKFTVRGPNYRDKLEMNYVMSGQEIRNIIDSKISNDNKKTNLIYIKCQSRIVQVDNQEQYFLRHCCPNGSIESVEFIFTCNDNEMPN